MRRMLALTAILAALAADAVAQPKIDPAGPIRIVALGASNTRGWGVGRGNAWPARLEALLRQRGYNAHVANAGKSFATTDRMLRKLDALVPDGTHIAIVEPGYNDIFFFKSESHRTGNLREIERRLKARGIRVILYDRPIPEDEFQWDNLHITREGHGRFAGELLAAVIRIIGPPPRKAAP